jgi:hypothetical protein
VWELADPKYRRPDLVVPWVAAAKSALSDRLCQCIPGFGIVIRKFVGWQLFSYWQLELFGSLMRNWVKPCLPGLLSFPDAWALVSHVKVLFGEKVWPQSTL